MDNKSSCHIRGLREMGLSYKTISETLNLPQEQVRSFCRRNDVEVQLRKEGRCPACGREVHQRRRGRRRTFCCDECRRIWWKNHEGAARLTRAKEKVCLGCGKQFKSYDSTRKYCSHACYITARYGEPE